jgi:hypothetical protein
MHADEAMKEPFGRQTVRLANLAVKKLHVYPIPRVSSEGDLSRLLGCAAKPKVDLRAVLEVNKKPTPTSIRRPTMVPTTSETNCSASEVDAANSRSFELPTGYITKSFSTRICDLLELRREDHKLLSDVRQLEHLSDVECVTLIYRWEIESVKTSGSFQIGQEMAKVIAKACLSRELSPQAFQLLYQHWADQWITNENRPICRAVWAYQQDLLAERAQTAPQKVARHTRGRRKSSLVANR